MKPADSDFQSIYEAHSPAIYALLLRILRNEHDAQEALQETFLQMWRKLDSFDASRGSVGAWATTIARSRAIDRVRAARRAPVEPLTGAFEPMTPSHEEVVVNRVMVASEAVRLERVLSRLPEEQQRAVELAYFQGLTHSEIANVLGEPLGTVKTRLLLAMRRLRDFYRETAAGSDASGTSQKQAAAE